MRLVALLDPWEAQLLIVLVPREVRGVAVETARDLQLDVLVEGRKAVTVFLLFLLPHVVQLCSWKRRTRSDLVRIVLGHVVEGREVRCSCAGLLCLIVDSTPRA